MSYCICYCIIEIIGSFLKGLQQDLPVNVMAIPYLCCCQPEETPLLLCMLLRINATHYNLEFMKPKLIHVDPKLSDFASKMMAGHAVWTRIICLNPSYSFLHGTSDCGKITEFPYQFTTPHAFIQETHIFKTEASVDRSLWTLSKGLWTDLFQQQESSFAWVDSLEAAPFFTGYICIYIYMYMLITCSCNSQMELIVIGASAKMGKMGGHFGRKKKGSESESW